MSEKLRRMLVIGGLLLVVGVVQFYTLRPGHNWDGDSFMYVEHAKNLAEGVPYGQTGYIYNPAYAKIGPPAYPPVCSLLLTPVYMFSGLDFEAMKLVMVASFVFFALFAFLCFCRELPLTYAAAIVLLTCLNRYSLGGANSIGSDLPFMALLYLTLLAFQEAYRTPVAESPRLGYLLPAAVFMYLSYGTRTLGGVLLPSVLLYDFLRYRRITRSACLVGMVFVALAIVQSLLVQGNAAYFDQYHVGPGVFLRNGFEYLTAFARFWHNGYFKLLGGVIFLLVTGLAALGYVSSVRRQVTLLEIFPALYIIAVLLFPAYGGARFVVPIFPLYLLFALRGLDHVWLKQRAMLRRAVFATLSLAVTGSYVASYTQLELEVTEGVSKPESVALFRYVAAETDRDDVIIFIKPRVMSLLTSRRSSVYHVPADDSLLWDYFDRIGATHLVVVENDDSLAAAEDPARLAYLRSFAERNRANLSPAFANADFRVYRIVDRNKAAGI